MIPLAYLRLRSFMGKLRSQRFSNVDCLVMRAPRLSYIYREEKSVALRCLVNAANSALIVFLFISCGNSFAQSAEKEPLAIIEVGGAANRSITDGGSSFGPTVAVEVTPIEHWLELEAGVTPSFNSHSTEWTTDLLFKKPWTLSRRMEFMVGVGPEWIRTNENGIRTNSVGAQGALDFMFWPSAKRKFGWYVEPGYDYNFGKGEHSLGVNGGLLIAIP